MIVAQSSKPVTNIAELAARGPARLMVQGEVVKLRRKGLALLYYLALEGPTSREKVSHILWGHGNALQNLRVELHRLKDALLPFGLSPITDKADPLSISQGNLVVTVAGGEPLEGLDDVSPQYQDWLERQRIRGSQTSAFSPRTELVEALHRAVELPYVIVLAGEPGSGRKSVARDLAARLQLPFVIGAGATAPSVNYVDLAVTGADGIAEAIVNGEERLWVLARSVFGIEPELVLKLRAHVAPERMRFVKLGQLAWWDAKQMFPGSSTFAQMARFYLASLGNPRYLAELLKLEQAGHIPADGELPVPLTIRASHALEARNLSPGSRAALEILSCQVGELSTQRLESVGLSVHLPELEESGWLRFGPSGWAFASELARRMVLSTVPEGTRHLHNQVLTSGSGSGAVKASRKASAEPVHEAGVVGASRQVPTQPLHETRQVSVASEVFLDPPALGTSSARLGEDRVLFSRPGIFGQPSLASWAPESGPLLYRVLGRAFSDEGAVALSIWTGDARLDVEVSGKFEFFLLARGQEALRVSSDAASSVIELCACAYKYAELDSDAETSGKVVSALRLHAGQPSVDADHRPPLAASADKDLLIGEPAA